MNQVKGLDTLRAFAVILVVITHWGPFYDDRMPVRNFIKTIFIPDGATGVYIFFTLSGFLITSILLKARFADAAQDKLHILKNFIVRRTLRIFPVYYLFLFAFYFIYASSVAEVKNDMPWFLTYTTNIRCYITNSWNAASHLWTLAIEEQFYLLWPWLILFLNGKYLKYLFAACIAIGIVTTYAVLKVKAEPFLMPNCIDSFAIGGLYAYMRLRSGHAARFEKVIRKLAPYLLVIYFSWKILPLQYHIEPGVFMKKTVESMLTVWLIILILNNSSARVKKYLLENKLLNFIGKISYCIYLVHPFIPGLMIAAIERIKPMTNPGMYGLLSSYKTIYCLDAIALILICWLSYIVIEKPFLSLKKFFAYNKQGPNAPNQNSSA